jgi:hypothetical protein
MNRKTWVIIGLLAGLALLVAGFFTPGHFCMDACSPTPPNFQMLIVGAVLPFILVGIPVGLGGILWLIIFAVIRSGEKLKDQPAPTQPLS